MKDVSIIIPAYNEAKFIEKAILSAVSQAEFVIVSDNCSTDGTQEICKRLAKEFSNLVFYEQESNIGAIRNFEFLLSKIHTKYLLHIGAHDFISEDYVSTLKKSLENSPEAVVSYAPYFSIDDNGKILDENLLNEFSEKLVSANVSERILAFTQNRSFIFTIFGLMKTQIFKKYFSPNLAIAGVDCLLLSQFISEGIFVRVPEARFYRRVITRHDSAEEYMKRITGNAQTIQYDLSYMCSQQFELLKSKSKNNLEEQQRVLNDFSLSMQSMHGNFCHRSLDETLNKLSQTDEKYILYGAGTDSSYIMNKLYNKILFIVDNDINKHNTIKDGIEIKSLTALTQSSDRIIISLLNRFELISKTLISEYNINPSRLVSPIDFSIKIDIDSSII